MLNSCFGVNSRFMIMQGLPSTITLLTIRALIRFLSSMYSHVIFQGLLFFERFATSITNVLESAGEVLCGVLPHLGQGHDLLADGTLYQLDHFTFVTIITVNRDIIGFTFSGTIIKWRYSIFHVSVYWVVFNDKLSILEAENVF